MSIACDKLQTLRLATTGCKLSSAAAILPAFRQHINTTHTLALYERTTRLSRVAAEGETAFTHELLDEWRSAESLRALVMDVTDLLPLIPEDYVTPDTRGVLYDETYNESSDPGMRCRLFVKVELPRSLVSLNLKIRNERVQQSAVVEALKGLPEHARERFPDL
jgi:hypothetical protein